jgi:integrase
MTPRQRKNDIGLHKGIYQHGKGFRVRVYLDGKPGWQPLKARTVEEANAEHARMAAPGAGTVGAGIQRYMETKVPELMRSGDLSASTWRTEKPRCEALIAVFGHMRPDSITTAHLYQFMDEASDGARKLKRLSAIWKFFIRWGLATQDPFFSAKGGGRFDWPKQKARTRYVTDDEMAMAAQVALEDGETRKASLRVWAALQMILLTGRRVTDVRKITLAQIEKGVGIRFRESKTDKLATPGWSQAMEDAVNDIKARLHADTKVLPFYLICNLAGHECGEGSLNQAMQRLRPKFKAAGLEPFQLRDIRAKYGTDHKDGAKALNHSNPATFRKHYDRLGKVIEPLK